MSYAIQQLSADEWCTYTLSRPDTHLLQRTSWGDLKQQFGWQPQYLAVVNNRGICGGAQLLWRSQLGLKMAYIPRGPIWADTAEANNILIKGLTRIARQGRAIFLRLEPNQQKSPAWDQQHSQLLSAGFRINDPMQPAASIHLNLKPDLDELFRNFSKGHRADVRKTERHKIEVIQGTTEEDLQTFYGIMQATAERAQFAIHSYEYYVHAWQLFSQHNDGSAQLLIARKDAEALAAFMIFAAGNEAQYMYSGATEAGLKANASHALQWAAIQWAKKQQCSFYDLWGIPTPFAELESVHDPEERSQLEAKAQATGMAGVYRFKKGWGGQIVEYVPAYDRVFFAPVYWLWQYRRGSNAA